MKIYVVFYYYIHMGQVQLKIPKSGLQVKDCISSLVYAIDLQFNIIPAHEHNS